MWGSLSGTIGRVSHSLLSHTKGSRSTREVEGQQRLASRLLTASHTTGKSNRSLSRGVSHRAPSFLPRPVQLYNCKHKASCWAVWQKLCRWVQGQLRGLKGPMERLRRYGGHSVSDATTLGVVYSIPMYIQTRGALVPLKIKTSPESRRNSNRLSVLCCWSTHVTWYVFS